MSDERLVPFMISIPEKYKNMLRKKAAFYNLRNPKDVTSAAEIARNLLIKDLEDMFNTDPYCEIERISEQAWQEHLKEMERNK